MNIFENKTVLITGGTGSMGKTLVRRILKGTHGLPQRVIIFSRDEAKQHFLRLELANRHTATDEIIYRNSKDRVHFHIGDVRSYEDLAGALKGVDICVNGAALKQVPSCEYFPHQAIQTNCLGAHNIVRAIVENDLPVETVVGVSTDKACLPVNVMGMSKALQERIFISANLNSKSTRFVCVRYGNVLASRGSVIPLFIEQIRNGGPVTITHEKMTRFLLSLEDAVDTVVAAIREARPGEIYIPVCKAVKIIDVAKVMVEGRPVPIEITGIRPGEKMHESLVSSEEATRTSSRGRGYYAIGSMLPELVYAAVHGETLLMKEYSSEDSNVDASAIRTLLKNSGLLETDIATPFREIIC